MSELQAGLAPTLAVELAESLRDDDLHALCEAADAAIIEGGGFGWVEPPGRTALESYFRGLLLVPERQLFVGRLDGIIVGSAQLVRPPRNNEAQAFAAQLMHSFVAPYARGHGLARMITRRVEDAARALGYQMLNLDVRETQDAAIKLYEGSGYQRWGEHPAYARVGGKIIRGLYYCKRLRDGR
ncbi:GNAT family N-acetyltransferase [Acidisphaera sp. L21]|jgi:ribosomal protein S18 acetylase RimI-like enzyme|uniref:GNAT family N-acetyltransferase n=1 Tax=Acidisphaera sp. L21 TaxID=1641851 RepID=UPI00131DF683|nr:GNAT family N-acetyltransferase [Acidisphaera sp. L21]